MLNKGRHETRQVIQVPLGFHSGGHTSSANHSLAGAPRNWGVARRIVGIDQLESEKKRMTPEDHKKEVQLLKNGVLANALA